MQAAAQSSDTAVDVYAQLSAAQQENAENIELIERHRRQLDKQKSYIEQLEEFIRNLRHKQFGASS